MQATTHHTVRSETPAITRETEHPQWSTLFLQLARNDLSATALRVLLFLLGKAEATGRKDWTFPVEFIGDALGSHRNTVSRALSELQKVGYVRRKAGLSRGAPTRTYLLLQPPLSNGHQEISAAQVGPRDVQLERILIQPRRSQAVVGYAYGEVAQPEPDQSAAQANTSGCETDQVAHQRSSGTPAVAASKALTRDELIAMQTFFVMLPACVSESLETAKALADPAALRIDPAWNLTGQQVEWLQRAIPKREVIQRRADNCVPRVRPSGEIADPRVAAALLQSIPRLSRLAGGEAQAAQIADEIACMVIVGGLGRGDLEGGVRAGLSIVAKGTWKRPACMSDAWRGAVLRGAQSRMAMH